MKMSLLSQKTLSCSDLLKFLDSVKKSNSIEKQCAKIALCLEHIQLKLDQCSENDAEKELLCTILKQLTDFFLTACEAYDLSPNHSPEQLDEVLLMWTRCICMIQAEVRFDVVKSYQILFTKLIQQIKNLCCFYQQIKLFRIYLLYLGFMSNSEGVFIISRMLVSAKFDVDLVDKLKVADSTSLYQCLEDLIHQYNENNNNIDNGESFSYRTSNISFNGKDKRHYHEDFTDWMAISRGGCNFLIRVKSKYIMLTAHVNDVNWMRNRICCANDAFIVRIQMRNPMRFYGSTNSLSKATTQMIKSINRIEVSIPNFRKYARRMAFGMSWLAQWGDLEIDLIVPKSYQRECKDVLEPLKAHFCDTEEAKETVAVYSDSDSADDIADENWEWDDDSDTDTLTSTTHVSTAKAENDETIDLTAVSSDEGDGDAFPVPDTDNSDNIGLIPASSNSDRNLISDAEQKLFSCVVEIKRLAASKEDMTRLNAEIPSSTDVIRECNRSVHVKDSNAIQELDTVSKANAATNFKSCTRSPDASVKKPTKSRPSKKHEYPELSIGSTKRQFTRRAPKKIAGNDEEPVVKSPLPFLPMMEGTSRKKTSAASNPHATFSYRKNIEKNKH